MGGLRVGAIGVVGVIAVVVVSLLASRFPATPTYNPELAAAWVQAVGSIAAIGAGAWFIRYQNDLARQRRRLAIGAMLEVALDVIAPGGIISEDGFSAGASLAGFNPHRFDVIHRALLAVPMHEVEPASHIVLIEEAVEILRRTARRAEALDRMVREKSITSVGNSLRADCNRLREIRAAFSG